MAQDPKFRPTLPVFINLVISVMLLAWALKANDPAFLFAAIAAWGSDIARLYKGGKPPAGSGLSALILVFILGAGCASIPGAFLSESRAAIEAQGEAYVLNGCTEITIAPEATVDIDGKWTLSGGLLAGCRAYGELLEFYCKRVDGKLSCESINSWYREVEE